MNSVFKTLAHVNVNHMTEKKGKFTYLSWAYAWGVLMDHYPDATHDMLDDVIYSDGTMEVRSSITISGQTQKMFLPVIDHKNNAIKNPNAFDINKNRMRCLVKNIAMFGLGLYIFNGEDLPQQEPAKTVEEWNIVLVASIDSIKESIASGDYSAGSEAWKELSDEEKHGIWVAPSKGGAFTTSERTAMQSTEFKNGDNIQGVAA
jgi:hypothetical protein